MSVFDSDFKSTSGKNFAPLGSATPQTKSVFSNDLGYLYNFSEDTNYGVDNLGVDYRLSPSKSNQYLGSSNTVIPKQSTAAPIYGTATDSIYKPRTSIPENNWEQDYVQSQLGSTNIVGTNTSGYSAGSLEPIDFGLDNAQLGPTNTLANSTNDVPKGMTGAEMWGVGLGVAGTSLNALGAYQDYKFAKADLKDKKERTNLLRERRDETAKFKSNTASAFR